MKKQHLFTAKSGSGWCTVVSIKPDGRVQMDSGSGGIVTLTIKDIRKIVREYNKAKVDE